MLKTSIGPRSITVVFSIVAVCALAIVAIIAASSDVKGGISSSRFGTSDVGAYLPASPRHLTAMPTVRGEFASKLVSESLYPGISSLDELLAKSRLVVRGHPTSFSAPYWNSADGSFWHPRYVGAEAGVPVESDLYRDVTFAVDEVLGQAVPGQFAKEVTFTVVGGQAVVTIPADVALVDPSFLAAGSYLWQSPAETDLVIGNEYIVFLDYRQFSLLNNDKYGFDVRLRPANTLFYAFRVDEGKALNLANTADLTFDWLNVSTDDLRGLAGSSQLGAWVSDRPVADGKIHPQPSDHVDQVPKGDEYPSPQPEVVPADISKDN